MNRFLQILKAEILKTRHTRITWITLAGFALGPVIGGLFMLIVMHPDAVAQSSILKIKTDMLAFTADWQSYMGLLAQVVAMGGVFVFGFVASWIFGREYSDGTAKDLLALPLPRASIIHAKFITYFIWCIILAISIFLIGLGVIVLLDLPGYSHVILAESIKIYFITTLLTIAMGPPIAFFAFIGKGYLAPLGFIVFTLILAQVIAAVGAGNLFPWSIPALYSGAAGEYKSDLNLWSYIIFFITSTAGYLATVFWWKNADQTK